MRARSFGGAPAGAPTGGTIGWTIGALTIAAALFAGCALEPAVTARHAEPAGETPMNGDAPATTAPDEPADPPTEPTTPPPTTPATTPTTTPGGPDTDPHSGVDFEPSLDAPTVPEPSPGTVDLADVAEVGDDKADRFYDDFVAASLVDLEEWMSQIHPEIHGVPWTPLAGGVYPGYPGRTDVPGCGEPSTDYRDLATYVAFYCEGGDFMVYDDGTRSLLGQLAAEYGPSVLGVVLAHEYAHAVQHRTGDLARRLPTILTEQQADCIAGAWVRRAASGESPHVTITDSEIRGALIAMVAVRDPVGTDQFDEGGHGSAFDRIGAFQHGYIEGPAACADLLDDPLPLMPNVFLDPTDRLNEGNMPFGYDDGQIAPLIVGTLNLYWRFQLDELGAGIFTPMSLVPISDAGEVVCSTAPRIVAPGLATCAADGTVYMDDGFARALYNDPIVGSADFAVGYFIALAWADLAQTQLGSTLTGRERALTNDCLVGAWTLDLDRDRPPRPDDGDNRGVISPGDLDEAVVAAIEIGHVTADDMLGSPFEKIDAFRSGVLGQIDACLDRINS